MAHDEARKFDSEDERIVGLLAEFASVGWQLWKAYADAEESSRRKDQFLAMLGHELRNPLAAMLSATTLLQRLATTERQTYALDVLARQGSHLSRIVDDLLDVSRLTQDKLELRKTRVELQAVAADAVETARNQIERRGHRLSVELPPAPVWLHADRVRVAQLLANLLDNAAKYTPDGGEIRLTASLSAGEVGGGEVAITVRDSGRGIAKEDLPAVFDLFVQPGSRADGLGGGLGLGLTLVRRLTEMHSGTVEAESDGPGSGSRFTVRLPTAPAPAAPQPPIASPGAVATLPRRILVVEDNADLAESFAMALVLDGQR